MANLRNQAQQQRNLPTQSTGSTKLTDWAQKQNTRATQSSTYRSLTAKRALDGNLDTFSQTDLGNNPNWY